MAAAAEKRVVGGMIGAAELQGATSDLAKSVRALYRDFLRASVHDPGVRSAARDRLQGFREESWEAVSVVHAPAVFVIS